MSTSSFKQSKVATNQRLLRAFYPLICMYFVLMILELYFSLYFVFKIVYWPETKASLVSQGINPDDFKQGVDTVLVVLYGLVAAGIILLTVLYVKEVKKYTQAMVSFHVFLTNYRQTPRSRFIRKYQPQMEPLYEENSAFEKSVLSSHMGNTVMQTSQHNLDLTSMNQTMHKTGMSQMINYDEKSQMFHEQYEDDFKVG